MLGCRVMNKNVILCDQSFTQDLFSRIGGPEMCNIPKAVLTVWVVEFLANNDIRVFSTKAKADEYIKVKDPEGKIKTVMDQMTLDPEPPRPEGPKYKKISAYSYDPKTGEGTMTITRNGKIFLTIHCQGNLPQCSAEADRILELLRGGEGGPDRSDGPVQS